MKRYPLIAYVDKSITHTIRSLQRRISQLTGSTASLETWEPHITIGSEVWLANDQVSKYEHALRQALKDTTAFLVTFKGYGFIENWSGGQLPGNTAYGMYLQITENHNLDTLVRSIRLITSKQKIYYELPNPYKPHLTLAFKDLTRDGYDKIKKLYKDTSFSGSTFISAISLARYDTSSGKNIKLLEIPLRQQK